MSKKLFAIALAGAAIGVVTYYLKKKLNEVAVDETPAPADHPREMEKNPNCELNTICSCVEGCHGCGCGLPKKKEPVEESSAEKAEMVEVPVPYAEPPREQTTEEQAEMPEPPVMPEKVPVTEEPALDEDEIKVEVE